MTEFVKAGDDLIPIGRVRKVDISAIENGLVVIETEDGQYDARGFDAIESVMMLKPSALEGRRLRWHRHAWAFHNIVGHPVVQLLAWMGFKREAVRFHDYTTPCPRGFK